ncbi:hypothetical protein BpHYR1_043417, partial [Brachionus plicatilis]
LYKNQTSPKRGNENDHIKIFSNFQFKREDLINYYVVEDQLETVFDRKTYCHNILKVLSQLSFNVLT